MPEQANVKNATVTTATISVKVMQLNNRQMSMAVVRQIPRDDEITGPLWGTVAYCHKEFYRGERQGRRIPACGIGDPKHREHRHVIWQDETDLRHAIIYPPEESETYGMLTYDESRSRLVWTLERQAEKVLAHPEIRAALTRWFAEEFVANPRERPFLRNPVETIEEVDAGVMVDPSSLPFVPADELTDEERATVEDALVSSYEKASGGYRFSDHYAPARFDSYTHLGEDPRAVFSFRRTDPGTDSEKLEWRLGDQVAEKLNRVIRAHPRLIGAVGSEEALERRWQEYASTRDSYAQESLDALLATYESNLALLNESEQAHRKLWSDVLELPHIYIAT